MIDDGEIGRRPKHLKAASGYRDAVQFLFPTGLAYEIPVKSTSQMDSKFFFQAPTRGSPFFGIFHI